MFSNRNELTVAWCRASSVDRHVYVDLIRWRYRSTRFEMFYDSAELRNVRFRSATRWKLCRDNWWLLTNFRQPPIIGDKLKTRTVFGEASIWGLRPSFGSGRPHSWNLVAGRNRQFTQITFHKLTSMMLTLDTNVGIIISDSDCLLFLKKGRQRGENGL